MSKRPVLALLEELGAIEGARGALIATPDGAFGRGRGSGLDEVVANDVAKTVRRMVVASATVGQPIAHWVAQFGASRVIVVPLRDDATLAVMVDRAAAIAPMMAMLRATVPALREEYGRATLEADASGAWDVPAHEDEVDRAFRGALGPVLQRLGISYVRLAARVGMPQVEAMTYVRAKTREWLDSFGTQRGSLPSLVETLALTFDGEPELLRAFRDEAAALLQVAAADPKP